jgi:poly-beta-hydroxyalkanoate depolymerase
LVPSLHYKPVDADATAIAAERLRTPTARRSRRASDYVEPGVGHYGVFNGTRWRTEIQPRIREMIRTTRFRGRIASVRSRVR